MQQSLRASSTSRRPPQRRCASLPRWPSATELWLDTLLAGQPRRHARIVRPFVTWHLLRHARQRNRRRPIINVAKIRAQTHLALQFLA